MENSNWIDDLLSGEPNNAEEADSKFIPVNIPVGNNCVEEIKLPAPTLLSNIWRTIPELTPPIIKGVLRQGHKMMVSGPSKAGKTFFLMELALCIAAGMPWIGLYCQKGTVLYVNLELDEKSCFNRFKRIADARGITGEPNVLIWNLRGHVIPFSVMSQTIADMVERKNIAMVIIDPIYKVFTGSENNQEVVTEFCNNLDVIAKAGASVVYCHHHSKGAQGDKSAMDRASGSGVFARDADALIDLIQLLPKAGEEDIDPDEKGVTGWLVSFTMREFRPRDDLKILFDYPLHTVCADGRLDKAKPLSNSSKGGTVRGLQQSASKQQRLLKVENICRESLAQTGHLPTKKELIAEIGVDERTIDRYCKELGYSIKSGRLTKDDSNDRTTKDLLSLLSGDKREAVDEEGVDGNE